jgi:hypothetical protein
LVRALVNAVEIGKRRALLDDKEGLVPPLLEKIENATELNP